MALREDGASIWLDPRTEPPPPEFAAPPMLPVPCGAASPPDCVAVGVGVGSPKRAYDEKEEVVHDTVFADIFALHDIGFHWVPFQRWSFRVSASIPAKFSYEMVIVIGLANDESWVAALGSAFNS